MIIINPGSENRGGTFKQALINAERWYKNIIKEFPEVTMSTHEDRCGNNGNYGNWNFIFTHGVTLKRVNLEIHGFTDEECEKFLFYPRAYWNGSSTANPEIEDWLTDDYTYRIVYEKN